MASSKTSFVDAHAASSGDVEFAGDGGGDEGLAVFSQEVDLSVQLPGDESSHPVGLSH